MRIFWLLLLLMGIFVWVGCAGRPETKPLTKRQYQEVVIREGGR